MTSQSNASETNQQQQENEILALEAIYSQDFTYTDIADASPRFRGVLTVELALPDEVLVYFANSKNANEAPLKIKHLPPVKIIFEMPDDYPTKEVLCFQLECCWMRWDWLQMLERKLRDIWEEERDVILFHFAEFIHNNAMDFLQIPVPMRFGDDYVGSSTLRTVIRAYNQKVVSEEFLHDHFTCGICFEEKLGQKCFQLGQCLHVFCRTCLSEYFTMLVREGFVLQVKCPEPGCRQSQLISKEELIEIIGNDMEERYSMLMEKQRLESDPLVTFCPRSDCQAPVKKDSQFEKLGVCTKCGFAFCCFCKRTWHGARVGCRINNTAKLVDEYLAADDDSKRMLELRYGAVNLAKLVTEVKDTRANEEWLKSNAQLCPQCETPIEKSMGCNHMRCTRCHTHFCYLCGNWIDPRNPYGHYNNAQSPCDQRLFDGANVEPLDEEDEFAILFL
ncbi:7621_t:CDS:2 [Paraglomus occultum]|uniref:RBR-type E3 ubiquitin transferase n=1 Tax=Paraglomus occultum TaxID=144539 RepID=A0A9N9G5Z7_9GLOM|nr:7621_t:CDS:2 [Paraglomus occultum]